MSAYYRTVNKTLTLAGLILAYVVVREIASQAGTTILQLVLNLVG